MENQIAVLPRKLWRGVQLVGYVLTLSKSIQDLAIQVCFEAIFELSEKLERDLICSIFLLINRSYPSVSPEILLGSGYNVSGVSCTSLALRNLEPTAK